MPTHSELRLPDLVERWFRDHAAYTVVTVDPPVRDALRGHEYVKSFEEGGDKEGGEGVTIAKIG